MRKHPLVRLLYNNNPLYVVSAALLLWGVGLCYRPEGNLRELWILLGIEGSYLFVLAAVAIWVVRWAKVWEDARTILFTIVLLLISISCLFDEVQILHPQSGAWLLIGGFTFSLAISELMIAAIKLRLGWLYRLPYYSLLAMFFAYPAVVARLAALRWTTWVDWVAWSFPVAIGLCLLGVLPAVMRGARYATPTGTPWDWPWYPLSFFYFIGILAGFRSWLLCVSFELFAPESTTASIFGGYFLVPIVLALLIVQLEVALKLDSRWMRNAGATIGALLLPGLGFAVSSDAASLRFWSEITSVAGSPSYLACVASGLFLIYCWVRKVESANWLLALGLAVFALTDTRSIDPAFGDPSPGAGILLSAVLLITAAQRSSCMASMLGVIAVILSLDVAFAWSSNSAARKFALLHMMIVVVVAHGIIARDPLGRILRNMGAIVFCVCGLATLLWFDMSFPQGTFLREGYLAAITGIMFVLWFAWRDPVQWFAAWVMAVELTAGTLLRLAELLFETFLRDGLIAFASAAVLLISAVVLSRHKSNRLSERNELPKSSA